METKPTVISTFAGCGGSSLGYRLAGYRELLALDYAKWPVATFRKNFPEVPMWHRDITEVTAQEILEFCGIASGELDVLDGSPPCQGFSMAGNRNVNDSRNDLFKEYVRLIEGLRPKVFVMENVPGMIQGSMQGRFIEIMKALKATGYKVKCKLMNTANYGVPQARRRLIWIGVRDDIGAESSFPAHTGNITTVREAFTGLTSNDLTGTAISSPELLQNVGLIRQGHGADEVCGGSYFNTIRLAWNRPAQTIIKTKNLLHPEEPRYLSIAECKRIASFPDEFEFLGSHTKAWGQVGNAVMPKFMQAIASHIKDAILTPRKMS